MVNSGEISSRLVRKTCHEDSTVQNEVNVATEGGEESVPVTPPKGTCNACVILNHFFIFLTSIEAEAGKEVADEGPTRFKQDSPTPKGIVLGNVTNSMT